MDRCRQVLTVLVGLVVLTAACGSSDDGVEGELLPFSQVQASEFQFEADPANPERGIFRVRTTEPMICAIVWGETEAFGRFNNSLSMNGTGIIDHDVVLPGAEQGKTYFFRVQGTTAAGDQYRSETGTFTIPVSEPAGGEDQDAVDLGENIALGASVVAVSSVFGTGWEAENALDGDATTEWATAGDGDSGFITIDLGAPTVLTGVAFLTRSMLDGTATTEMYTVTVDDGEALGPFPAGNPANPDASPIDATGQQVRFDVESSTGGNVGAIEIQLFTDDG